MNNRYINSMLREELDKIAWVDVLSITKEKNPKWFILRLTYFNERITDYIYLSEEHRNDDMRLLMKHLDINQ